MSSNTSASPEPKISKASKPAVKKVPTKKPASKSKPKSTSVSHPSWKEIITECIIANRDDSARSGVSRSTIKKFAQEMYKLDAMGTGLYQLNRAITSGAESGMFVLPKGPSGKVKLAPKAKPTASNENTKPPSVKKTPAVTKPKSATTKAAPVKKSVPKKPVAKAPTKKVAAKKVVAKKSPALPRKVSSTKRTEKKAAAKTAASKPKPKAKPASRSRAKA